MKIKDFKIAYATTANINELVDLERVSFSGDLITKYKYKSLLQRKNVNVYGVWFQGGLIASAVIINDVKKKISRLYSFCVTPPMQSMGIGSALLTTIEQDCANNGSLKMRLEVSMNNEQAYRLYCCKSYVVIGKYKKYYQDGSDAIRMEKMLELNMNLEVNKNAH